jgi:hypothetical protein
LVAVFAETTPAEAFADSFQALEHRIDEVAVVPGKLGLRR